MTRSSQQPLTSPGAYAEPASEDEQVKAPTATVRAAATAESESEPVEAQARAGARKGGAEASESESKPGEFGNGPAGATATTGPGVSAGALPAETEAESGGRAEPGTSAGALSEPGADPGAAEAPPSRLPGFVRTMTATAIGKPEQGAGPVGRPGKAALAGATVVGALLVSVPFLVLVGNDDKGPEQSSVAAAGTVLDGGGQEAPGDFEVTLDETGGAASVDEKRNTDVPEPGKPVRTIPDPQTAKDVPKKAAEPQEQPEKEGTEKEPDVAKEQSVKAAPAVTFSAPVSFRSYLSGRCIDVPGHDFSDGRALHVWDCNGAPAQKWQFASDGTIRIQGKCLDVANADFGNGTLIQIARCNGNAAQKFALNDSHDLVNTVVGMCVDIVDANRNSGAPLQLLTCTGNSAQKWST